MATAAVITADTAPLLSDELLVRCHDRSPADDDGAGISANVNDLHAAGFLRLPLPTEFGGPGLGLLPVATELRRLAYYAAPTAGRLWMHLAWLGVAADRWRAGDDSLRWMLEEAARGQRVAAAHAEPGNDAGLLLAGTQSERVDGGVRITGHKRTAPLLPDWAFVGLNALDATSTPPCTVHAVLPRNTEGYLQRAPHDGPGIAPDGGEDLLLDGVFIPDRFVAHRVPVLQADRDPFTHALLAWTLLLQSHAVAAQAQRALDLVVDVLHRTTTARPGLAGTRPAPAPPALAHDPVVQHRLAPLGIAIEAMEPQLERASRQWMRGARRTARWPMTLLAVRQHVLAQTALVIDGAREVVDDTAATRRMGLDALADFVRTMRGHPIGSQAAQTVIGRGLLGLPGLGPL